MLASLSVLVIPLPLSLFVCVESHICPWISILQRNDILACVTMFVHGLSHSMSFFVILVISPTGF